MAWQEILKASEFLEKLEPKQKKKIKKLLQSTQPNEYMGQEMTKLEDLIKELEELDIVKSDKLLTKKVKSELNKDFKSIVFHDAYQYFEKRFDINVLGAFTVNTT